MGRKRKVSNGCAFIFSKQKGYPTYTDGYWHSNYPDCNWDEFVVTVREILTKQVAESLTGSEVNAIICGEDGAWETVQPFEQTGKVKRKAKK